MIAAYRWESNWKITLLVVIALPILMRLGFWQLERAEEKRQLQAHYAAQTQRSPVTIDAAFLARAQTLASAPSNEQAHLSMALLPVAVMGSFDHSRTLLLDNRIQNGQVGYEVLTPFMVDAGFIVLINRGWVAGSPDRRILPDIPRPPGQESARRLVGHIYVPHGKPVLLAEDRWSTQWPVVIQWEDMVRIERLFEPPLFPYSVRLDAGQSSALAIAWQPVNSLAEKHRGYAVQWFAMSVALFGFWLYSSLRRVDRSESKTDDDVANR